MTINACETRSTGICIYSNRSSGVCRYIILISMVMNFASSVEIIPLSRIFVVIKSAVFVVSSPG